MGGGLTPDQVNAQIADWAETDNVSVIPDAKLPEPTTGQAGIVEYATNTEALDSTVNDKVIRPNNLHHVLDAHIVEANAHHIPPVGGGDGLTLADLPHASLVQQGIIEIADIDEIDAGAATPPALSPPLALSIGCPVSGAATLLRWGCPARSRAACTTPGSTATGKPTATLPTASGTKSAAWALWCKCVSTIFLPVCPTPSIGHSVGRRSRFRLITARAGAIHPAKPPALSAVLREYNTETFMWKWVVVTDDIDPFIHTSITLVGAKRQWHRARLDTGG